MVPSRMHAALLTGHGGSGMRAYSEDVAVPSPEADEVLVRVGERVMVDFGIFADEGMDTPDYDYTGSAGPGGFADFVAVPAAGAHRVETGLGDAELATFCCAYVTCGAIGGAIVQADFKKKTFFGNLVIEVNAASARQ